MKLFHHDQEFYEILQIYPKHPNQRCSVTIKTLFIIAGMILLFCSAAAFSLFKAKSTEELAFSFFSSISMVVCTTQLVVVIWKIPYMQKLIEKMEQFIEKRESQIQEIGSAKNDSTLT